MVLLVDAAGTQPNIREPKPPKKPVVDDRNRPPHRRGIPNRIPPQPGPYNPNGPDPRTSR